MLLGQSGQPGSCDLHMYIAVKDKTDSKSDKICFLCLHDSFVLHAFIKRASALFDEFFLLVCWGCIGSGGVGFAYSFQLAIILMYPMIESLDPKHDLCAVSQS